VSVEPAVLAILVASFAVILVGAELFTNAVEWLGRRLNVGEGVVGSILAATGTALPETLIPIVAIGFGGAGATTDEIGVGAILGAPFMLSTLALAVTAVAVLARGRRRRAHPSLVLNGEVVGADLRYFYVAYGIAVASALVPAEWQTLRWLASGALVLTYAAYVRAHLRGGPADLEVELAPLHLGRPAPLRRRGRHTDPPLPMVAAQLAVALVAIIGGAVAFVGSVEELSLELGVAPVILALIIAPIATELPEKFNSIIWIRKGKDTLAIGNITGAMVFQSCLPVIVAILFAPTSWTLNASTLPSFASAGIAFISSAIIFWPLTRGGVLTGRRLLVGGVFYLAYVAYLVFGGAAGAGA
jgi:cation:H+ antiporter